MYIGFNADHSNGNIRSVGESSASVYLNKTSVRKNINHGYTIYVQCRYGKELMGNFRHLVVSLAVSKPQHIYFSICKGVF